jgi:transposase
MRRKLSLLSKKELQDLLQKQDEEICQREKDLRSQEKQNLKQSDKILTLRKEIKSLNKMMLSLNSKITSLTKKIFGKSSEKIIPEAQSEPEKGKEDSDIKILPDSKKEKSDITKKRDRHFPKDIPRDEIHHKLLDSELDCECGGRLKEFSTEESELVDIIPEKIRIRKNICHKYSCSKCKKNIKRAKAPKQFLPCRATNRFVSHVITQKFMNHIPYHRQSKEFALSGINISRDLMCNYTIYASNEAASLIVKYLTSSLLTSNYIRSDETTLQVIDDKNYKSYIWCHMNGERKNRIVIYKYSDNRRKENSTEFLSGFQGYHQTDGYSGYDELHRKAGVIYVACMAHVRRKFFEVYEEQNNKKSPAYKILKMIKLLYDIERKIKKLEPDKKKEIRIKKSKKILQDLKEILEKHQKKNKDSTSKFIKAVGYALNRFDALMIYLEDGRLFIDNNDNEQAIRPIAIGRKNWMFFKSSKGAEAAANFYSIILTCLENDINPYKYLVYVFNNWGRIKEDPEKIKEILPHDINPEILA